MPRALSRGARLFADCRVERITRQGKRATGVEGYFVRPGGHRGPRLSVRAGAVISACGSIQTPALLWRSGFRSPSGQLGRNLSLHPNAKLVALFDDEVYGWQGVHQAYQVRQFMDAGILITAINIPPSLLTLGLPQHGRELGTLMKDYNRMVVAGCLIDNSRTGRVQDAPRYWPCGVLPDLRTGRRTHRARYQSHCGIDVRGRRTPGTAPLRRARPTCIVQLTWPTSGLGLSPATLSSCSPCT